MNFVILKTLKGYLEKKGTKNMKDILSIYRMMYIGSGFGFEDLTCEQKDEILNKVFDFVSNIIVKENSGI